MKAARSKGATGCFFFIYQWRFLITSNRINSILKMKIMNVFAIALAGVFGLCACGGGSDEKGNGGGTEIFNLSASPENFSFKAEGGEGTINVDASRDWSVFPSNNEVWISISPSSGTAGKAAVKLTAKANDTYEPREAEITVKAGTERKYIKVKQEAAERPELGFDVPTVIKDKGYNLVWNDEFDEGTELNSSKWRHEVQGDHWVNNELQSYVNHTSPEGKNVTELKNGKLRINCFKEGKKIYSGRVYGNKGKGFKYGYIEASIKLPKGKGTWPAFWMMPCNENYDPNSANYNPWPICGEIDIMEEVGYHPNYVSSSLHADGHVHSKGNPVTHEMYQAGAEGEFHTYSILWTADNITTYVDGKVQLSYDNNGKGKVDWPYNTPFYVILNLAWGGDWGGSQGVDEGALPVTMEVDFVRVWQK